MACTVLSRLRSLTPVTVSWKGCSSPRGLRSKIVTGLPTTCAGVTPLGSASRSSTMPPGAGASSVPARAWAGRSSGFERSVGPLRVTRSALPLYCSRAVASFSEIKGVTERTPGRVRQRATTSSVIGCLRCWEPNWVKKPPPSARRGRTKTFSRPSALNWRVISRCTPTPSDTIVTMVRMPTITPVEVSTVRTLRRPRLLSAVRVISAKVIEYSSYGGAIPRSTTV